MFGMMNGSWWKIGAWFRMQLVLSAIMGLIGWGGLTLLGVQGAFLIGCLAAIFELVPFIGPGAFAVVSASTQLAFYTLILSWSPNSLNRTFLYQP